MNYSAVLLRSILKESSYRTIHPRSKAARYSGSIIKMSKNIPYVITATLLIIFASVYILSQPSSNTASFKNTYQENAVRGTSSESELPKPPDFTLPKFDGSGHINLVASYNDKPTIIQFWATWCEFCRREFPVTNAIVATQKDKINFIAVNFSQESKAAVRNYIKELNLDPTILTFVMDETGAVGRAYGITGTPVHVFIKKGGEVNLFQVGYMSPQLMKDEVSKIL